MTDDSTPGGPNRPSLNDPMILAATWFGSGYLPKAPGTWGSLAALPFAWIIAGYAGPWALAAAVVVVFVVGVRAANRFIAASGADDPAPVVIDEVAGQWLALIVVPLEPVWYLAGFAAFRAFDVFKPWPVNWLDRNIKGGLGVMADDIAAGAYAALLLVAAQYWLTGMGA